MEDYLPEEDWEMPGSSGKLAYMQGRFKFSICERLCEEFPDDVESLMKVPPAGQVKFVALAEDGFVLHDIIPSPLQSE